MKKLTLVTLWLCVMAFFGTITIYGQTCGRGITYTSSFPRVTGGPTFVTPSNGTKYNDTSRLQSILTQCSGKIIFNEDEYYINDTLPVFSYRLIEGSGTGINNSNNAGTYPANTALHPSSKIIQIANKPIFKIGPNIVDVAIRDLALIGGLSMETNADMLGILAEGGLNAAGQPTSICNTNPTPPAVYEEGYCSSIKFQFSNLHFKNLVKGIYVNARDSVTVNGVTIHHQWQFDNVRLDHVYFENCKTGVHINSYNSGWNISSIEFFSPAAAIGFDFERSTYTSVNGVIGNGPSSTPFASRLFQIKEHANLSIQSSVSEGFSEDVNINNPSATGAASPITLTNNHFNGKVTVNNGMVVSIGNTFGFQFTPPAPPVQAIATNNSYIFSIGDKLCDYNQPCTNKWQTDSTSKLVFGSDVFKTTTTSPMSINRDVVWSDLSPSLSIIAPTLAVGPLMRLGRGNYYFDVSRSEADATLTFMPNVNGYGYTFNGRGGNFNITGSYLKFSPDVVNGYGNGTVTLGTNNFTNLGSADSGTMWFCSDCQETNPCTGGGSGAIAKKLPSKWTCN